MQRKIHVTGTLEKLVADKFMMIYMEWDKEHSTQRPLRGTIWHLEDETRPTQALCGYELHERCVSVSPALAMFGTPCKACKTIVAVWLEQKIEGQKISKTNQHIASTLLVNDVNFRKNVHLKIHQDLFNINAPKEVKPSPRSRKSTKTSTVPSNSDLSSAEETYKRRRRQPA